MCSFGRHSAHAWLKRSTVFFLLLVSALPATAQTVLIGPGVRNGDFEAGTGTGNRSFTQTPPWVNIGSAGQVATCAITNDVYAGERTHAVAESTSRLAAQDTGYDIVAGDLFAVSYFWREAFQWHDPSDQLAIRLFTTTDNTTSGTATTFATLLSGISTNNNSYQVTAGIATATASEAGKRLFVAIDTQDGNSNSNGFARLDDFHLTVLPLRRFPATGGAQTNRYTVGGTFWIAHVFTEAGSFTPRRALDVEYLIIGGGGGGGGAANTTSAGGGGGAGGLVTGSINSLAAQAWPVVVGGGGGGGAGGGGTPANSQRGATGDASSAFGVTALGGGGGGRYDLGGRDGGSGGGAAARTSATGGTGGTTLDVSQGNNGGARVLVGGNVGAASGGGAGGPGVDTANDAAGRPGGLDVTNSITGSAVAYAGGGGGGAWTGGSGGLSATGGHGGDGNAGGVDAHINTGGGGGGMGASVSAGLKGGNGGSGIVIVRYQIPLVPIDEGTVFRFW